MIPTQIRRVLSTIRRFDVPALLMGGQACVLYGAAEFSRDIDLAVLASPGALTRLTDAMHSLDARVIAVPPFRADYLTRGHAVHFEVLESGRGVRVDVMSRMRGVDDFPTLWSRRTTLVLDDGGTAVGTMGGTSGGPPADGLDAIDVFSLEDLVAAKKTQRDKDWPMLRRLVDASYANGSDGPTEREIAFWLSELRTPEFLREAVSRFPHEAAESRRPAVAAVMEGRDVEAELAGEQRAEMDADRAYWEPLRRELEILRDEARVVRPPTA